MQPFKSNIDVKIISKYLELKKSLKADFNFNVFINHLNGDELLETLELIFSSKIEFLNLFFKSTKNIDVEELAIDKILDQPYFILEKISEQLNIIFERSLKKHYGDKSNQVIDKILTCTSKDIGLSSIFIQSVIKERNVDPSIKISLLFILHSRNQMSIIQEFINSWQVENDPHLIPFVIQLLHQQNENKTIEYLKKFELSKPLQPSPATIKWYHSIIFNIVDYAKEIKKYDVVKKLYSIDIYWFKSIVQFTLRKEENFLKCIKL